MKVTIPVPSWVEQTLATQNNRAVINAFMVQRVDFYADLSRALDSKMALGDWLKKNSSRLAKSQPTLAKAFSIIAERNVESSFSDALVGFVPAEEITVIAAADASGKLPSTLRYLADTVKKRKKISSLLFWAVVTGGLTAFFGLYSLWQIAGQIIPIMHSIGMRKENLQGVGYWAYVSSDFVYVFGPYIGASMLVAAYACYRSMPAWMSSRRRKWDKYFIAYRMYQEFSSAMFMLSYGTLKTAGNGDKESIQKISKTSPAWLKWHCNAMLNRLVQHGLSQPVFETGLFSRRIADRLGDLCERGTFNDVITEIGKDVLEETMESLTASATKIEYALSSLTGVVLLFVTFAMPALVQDIATRLTQGH